MIEIKINSQKGRGVFAKKMIPKETFIEVAPVSSFPVEQWEFIKKTDIFKYCFAISSEYKKKQKCGWPYCLWFFISL